VSHSDALKKLFPISLGGRFDEDIAIEGQHLDGAESSADTLLANLVPNAINQDLIEDWEKTLAIIPSLSSTLEERFNDIVFNLQRSGGLSKPYFISLADALGFTVEIEDIRPFESGIGMVGWPIMDPGIKWCWLVRVLNHTTTPSDFTGKTAVAYTALGDGWLWRWDTIGGPLESLFNKLTKAGGMPLFVYPV